jgi:hypothetical protein
MERAMDMKTLNLETLKKELQDARRARIAAQNAGCDLESLVERIRLGFSLRQIELGLAAPAH